MSISFRLKEERQRLGLSQTAFAALAGATKSAQIKWESGASSAPTAPALAAFAEAGADILYILTGRRTPDRPDNAVTQTEDRLDNFERELRRSRRFSESGEDEERAERGMLIKITNSLRTILVADAPILTPELKERAASLLDIAEDPTKLSLFRAADYAQMRKKREQMKEQLSAWFEGGPYEPEETVKHLLAQLALEHAVPVQFLVELTDEIYVDVERRLEKVITSSSRESDGPNSDIE